MSDTNKLETLVEQLGKLTVVEALELSKKLEEAWGVSATAAASAPVAGATATAEAKSELTVVLTGFNDNAKIPVLKKVREYTSLGLLEARAARTMSSLNLACLRSIDPDGESPTSRCKCETSFCK